MRPIRVLEMEDQWGAEIWVSRPTPAGWFYATNVGPDVLAVLTIDIGGEKSDFELTDERRRELIRALESLAPTDPLRDA